MSPRFFRSLLFFVLVGVSLTPEMRAAEGVFGLEVLRYRAKLLAAKP